MSEIRNKTQSICKLIKGDCLDVMPKIPNEVIDMILADLPYGTTKNKFDKTIDMERLWNEYKRIIKKNGCIALFAQTPFDKVLGTSNLEMLKYEWIWEKPLASRRLNCNFAPLKAHENILIFSKSAACYVKNKDNAMIYNPQMTSGKPYVAKTGRASTNYDTKWHKNVVTVNKGERYPRSVLQFSSEKGLHPNQKPVALCEYLIKTYTNKNDVVLDNCMGSGTTGIACKNLNRNFIGIEIDEHYYNIAKERIENVEKENNFE